MRPASKFPCTPCRPARTSASRRGRRSPPATIIFKITRETSKTKDITGGLPRVAELFEARKPKENAVISEINGHVKFAGTLRGMRRLMVVSEEGDEREYLIPRGKHVNVQEGDYVGRVSRSWTAP